MKTVANLVIILLLHLASQSLTVAQIIFTRDTLLTGTHVFSQHVGVYDSSVTVEIESAQISFEQGMTVEYGKLLVRQNSTLVFANGYPLNISRNAHFDATTNSSFWGTKEMPIGLTLWKCTAYVSGCQFVYVRMSVMETWGDTIKTSPTFEMRNSIMTLDYDDMNPMLFSQGVNMKIYSNLFRRDDGSSVGQYPNIHIQSNKYTIVEQCSLDLGGISAGSILNSDIEIIDNIIENANKGISFWGVNKIEYNIFNNVNIGIEGGTLSNPLNDVRIHYNHILNNSELAIDVVGHNIVINENIITGSGETARGIKFNGSNSKITYNLLRDFKIDDSVYEVDGVALHIKNAGPGVEVIGNVFEHCGLSSTASFDKVCSIVYLESPVIFMSNDIRLSTLGGPASPTNSFAGGPVLDIISTSLGIPTVKYNLIHSNIFVALGSYEPTNTNGTLVAIDINYNHGMVEFKGNYLIGDPLLSLGVAIFPDGAIDSLLFEENTIMDNYVGIGTMQTPVLGTHNIIKDNTHYHIMRYGYGTSPTLYALSNNWDSDDPAVIDSLLFDDEEGINTGPIDFDFYYSTSYNLNVNYTIPPHSLIQGIVWNSLLK